MSTQRLDDRYSAKLLFEFYVVVDGQPLTRRTCEERIVIVHAATAKGALSAAKRIGRAGEFRFRNAYGDPGHFRLVGVMDLLRLGLESGPDEVWYDITQRVRPSERRARILPRETELNAFREEAMLRGERKAKPKKVATALPNKRMQLTRSALANGRRGPRS